MSKNIVNFIRIIQQQILLLSPIKLTINKKIIISRLPLFKQLSLINKMISIKKLRKQKYYFNHCCKANFQKLSWKNRKIRNTSKVISNIRIQ